MSDYTPTTEEVRQLYVDATRELLARDMYLEEIEAEFDRWLAEVKAQRDNYIISLIKKDCEHKKFGDYCTHDHLIGEIMAQLDRRGEN